jgi:hypothetical protein
MENCHKGFFHKGFHKGFANPIGFTKPSLKTFIKKQTTDSRKFRKGLGFANPIGFTKPILFCEVFYFNHKIIQHETRNM